MGVLRVLNHTGDVETKWSEDNPRALEKARTTFEEMIGKGYLAFDIDKQGNGEQIRKFKPEATEVILTPQLRGG